MIIDMLNQILENKHNRIFLVKEFQKKVWNNEINVNAQAQEILNELAYDLDFYEPNETNQSESPSYYDEERVEQEIKSAIKRLSDLK